MISLFLRLFGVLSAATIATLLLVHLLLRTGDEERALSMLQGHAKCHAMDLAATHPADRRDYARALAEQLGYGVHLQPRKGLTTRTELRGAQVFVITPIPKTDGQLALGPIPTGQNAELLDAMAWALLVSSLVAGAVAWPVFRRVKTLEALAERMRAGDFRARIRLEEGDVFDRVGASLNTLADRIGQLLADERDLLRTVAHEVRAPIARMRFRVDKLSRHTDGESEKTTAGLVSDLTQVDNLFEELLTYVAFDEFDQDGPPLTMAPISVRETVREVVSEVTAVDEEIEVEIRGSAGCEVEANQKLFERAVTNLLLNAMAYGGPRIVVEIRDQQDFCVVDVQDSGLGIPELDRPKVVKPFVRLNSKKKKGTGLGLAIVSRIMRLHGGHLHIMDHPDGGASIQLAWRKRPPRASRKRKVPGLVSRGG